MALNTHPVLLEEEVYLFPLVDAFWSVTAYDANGYLIPNAAKRQALGERATSSLLAPDGLDEILSPPEVFEPHR